MRLVNLNVLRETMRQFEAFLLLEKWQRQINLVANSTMADIWQRHILDSATLSFTTYEKILDVTALVFQACVGLWAMSRWILWIGPAQGSFSIHSYPFTPFLKVHNKLLKH